MIVFSDVHGHRTPLARLLDGWAGPFVCAGDVLGTGGDNEGCVALLRERGIACVRGNHDEDVGLRFRYNLELSVESRVWLDSLATVWRAGETAAQTVVTHTLIQDGVYQEVESSEAAAALLEQFQARVVLIGHSHLPGWWSWARGFDGRFPGRGTFHPSYSCESFKVDGPVVINVGTLGEPRPPQRSTFVRLQDGVVSFGRL